MLNFDRIVHISLHNVISISLLQICMVLLGSFMHRKHIAGQTVDNPNQKGFRFIQHL